MRRAWQPEPRPRDQIVADLCERQQVVFNIKETFLQESDRSGFSMLVKHLLVSDTLQVHHLERYRHRISIDGRALFYYVVVGRKEADIANGVLSSLSRD